MEELERAIRDALIEGKLPCAQAFVIAAQHGVEPIKVGQEATRLGIKINRCQLGLFGYEDQGKRRIVQPAKAVSKELEKALCSRLDGDRLTCLSAWEIAEEHGLSTLEVANAVESLNLRISACQLGCFP